MEFSQPLLQLSLSGSVARRVAWREAEGHEGASIRALPLAPRARPLAFAAH